MTPGPDLIRKARKAARLVGVPAYRRGLRYGVAATVEHNAVAFGADFRSIVDIGAHAGQFAVFCLGRFPEAAIHCFEPLAGPRLRLQRVLKPDREVTIHPYAVSSATGSALFHVSAKDDSSSLFRISERQTRAFPGTQMTSTVKVETVRLDEVLTVTDLTPPALLKLDVQGAELEALKGATGVLDCFAEVLVECSFVELYEDQPLAADVVCFLAARGFRLAAVESIVKDARGRCLQADLLFSRETDESAS